MKCTFCGGYVEWKGTSKDVGHTECRNCGNLDTEEDEEKMEYTTSKEATIVKPEIFPLLGRKYIAVIQGKHSCNGALRANQCSGEVGALGSEANAWDVIKTMIADLEHEMAEFEHVHSFKFILCPPAESPAK